MFKKIALVAMLAAGSLQAGKFEKYVTKPAIATVSFAKDTVLGCNVTKDQISAPMANKTVITTSAINTVSRIALATQLFRALNAAKKADKGEKVDAAKKVLTTKATTAAAAGTVLGLILGTKKVNGYLTK